MLSSHLLRIGLGLGLLAGCSFDSDPAFGDADGRGGTSSGTGIGSSGNQDEPVCGTAVGIRCADEMPCSDHDDCQSQRCVDARCAAARDDDGVQNGDETDVDCGGSSAPACAEGKACRAPTDCNQQVCTAGECQPARDDDGVKNGDETDVDCGGPGAPACAVDRSCLVHTDCASDACNHAARCVARRSCTLQAGGETCGAGEVDDPARQHESCCSEIALPNAGTFLDRYMITAGRMQTFVERTGGNLQGWIDANKPAWWDAEYASITLPSTLDQAYEELGPYGASGGCYISGTGARTFWVPDAANQTFGDDLHAYSREVLDTKALNCVRRPMLAALCAFDGKRLPTRAELREAWGDATFPWGAAAWNSTLAVHRRSYFWPQPVAGSRDQSYHIAAPGRRPLGNGPLGHADLGGLLFDSATGGNTIAGGSFEAHAIGGGNTSFAITRKYWAIGGRCARDAD